MNENVGPAPHMATALTATGRSITDSDIRWLRWSLIGFGLLGIITPLALASQLGGIYFDPLALMILVVAATLNRHAFASFPWTALFCLLYPAVFVAGCFSPEVFDGGYWFLPRRGSSLPQGFYAILAVWAGVNIGLIGRFHRIQRLARGESRPLQYSLRFLLGLTFFLALVLALGTWYYRLSQPPPWATVEALERRYGSQLNKLAKYAYDYGSADNYQARSKLKAFFTAEEIVDAGVWTKSSGCTGGVRMTPRDRGHRFPANNMTCLWTRSPGIGRPIVNLWGKRYVEYQALLKDRSGAERGYTLVVDLSKMSEGHQP